MVCFCKTLTSNLIENDWFVVENNRKLRQINLNLKTIILMSLTES